MSNHELAKRYIKKQELLGMNQLELRLIENDGVELVCIQDKGVSIVIPRFITSISKDVTFEGTHYSNIEIQSNAEIQIDRIFNKMESEIIHIKFLNKFEVSDISYMFYGCKDAREIVVDGIKIEDRGVDISYLYSHCYSLEFVDMGWLGIGKVRNITGMFYSCTSLKGIKWSKELDMSSINNISDLFYHCMSLKDINIVDIGIKELKYARRTFKGCTDLKYIKVSGIDTSMLKSIENMCSECENLIEIDMSDWEIKGVLDMQRLFNGCTMLEVVDLSSIDSNIFQKLIDNNKIHKMFSGCNRLKLIILSLKVQVIINESDIGELIRLRNIGVKYI